MYELRCRRLLALCRYPSRPADLKGSRSERWWHLSPALGRFSAGVASDEFAGRAEPADAYRASAQQRSGFDFGATDKPPIKGHGSAGDKNDVCAGQMCIDDVRTGIDRYSRFPRHQRINAVGDEVKKTISTSRPFLRNMPASLAIHKGK